MSEALKKAVIYTRVSTHGQNSKGSGLVSQEIRCREYAEANGYEVIDVYSDKETGGRKDREGIVSMLRFLKRACKTEPHTVIIDDLNR
ncbi:MAG: recombinase family protein, partial [Rickettsiales bacterium]|nr:recombinase family protein [Rickettsiales bacterium]